MAKVKGRPRPSSRHNKGVPWEPCTRDLEIYASVTAGNSETVTGKAFKLSQVRIHQICKRIDVWLAPQFMEEIREMRARHTSHLMHVFHEAMAAWERSKLDEQILTVEKQGDGVKNTMRKKGQSGSALFLQEARAALAEIRKIWGADAAIDIRHSGEIRVAGRPIEEVRAEATERLTLFMGPVSN